MAARWLRRLDDKRAEHLNYGLPLYKASLKGDWEAARQIHSRYRHCFSAKITNQGDTALHIAVVGRHTYFVEKLVALMQQDECIHLLELRNNIGNTVLCLAAASGIVSIARVIIEADNNLLSLPGNDLGLKPLDMAVLLGYEDMVRYLLQELQLTRHQLSEEEWKVLFISTINSDMYDVALDLLSNNPRLAMARDDHTKETPLHILAKKHNLTSTTRLSRYYNIFNMFGYQSHQENSTQHKALQLVERLIDLVLREKQSDLEELLDHPWQVIFLAIEVGNVEFTTILIRSYPDLIWKLNDKNLSIFHVAVIHRQESIFSLIHQTGAIKELLALGYTEVETDNTILHLAAMLPSPNILNRVSGAALQMQREMMWFKVVEELAKPDAIEVQNSEEKTPRVLFTEQHKSLREAGEEWMRKTASSCSVVASLIASAVFGFVLKLPHDPNASLSKPPNYSWWYWVIAIFDSLSLISSTASTLVFLTILISRYAETDFLHSLPRKLMIGLSLLFLALLSVTFTTTFHMMVNQGWQWFGIILLAIVTIVLFMQELPLIWEVFSSSIGGTSIFQSPKHSLF